MLTRAAESWPASCPGAAGAAGSGGKSRRAAQGRTPAAEPPIEAEPVRALAGLARAAAKEQGVPVYVSFHDATLRQIAASPSSTLAELSDINGVGEIKLTATASRSWAFSEKTHDLRTEG
jgi:ATP-dependent DNA helicase RecQ